MGKYTFRVSEKLSKLPFSDRENVFLFSYDDAVYGLTAAGGFGIVRTEEPYLEGGVMHKIGHLIGLSDHCNNPECIMGYANMEAKWFCKICENDIK